MRRISLFTVLCILTIASGGRMVAQQMPSGGAATILMPQKADKAMPATVFFRGQTAPVQMRNAYGLQFGDGMLMLAALVDSSGYSSGIQQKYQGYLLTEVPLAIEGRTLPAGAYGFGFVAPNSFVVMDVGAHEVLRVDYRTDAKIARPRPLMITQSSQPGGYRLCANRRYVTVKRK